MSTRTITFNDSFSSASAPTGVDGISNWVTAQAYLVSDVVIQGSKIYECLIAHTAGVFATDLAAVKWGEISQGAVDHTALSNIGTNTHAQIDTHLANTSNPHSVTKAQVGLTNVDDTSDATKNAASVTLTNKTITGADFRAPIRLDMKQDTLSNLTTYASTAADGQLCFATDTKATYVVKNSSLSSVGGAGAGINYILAPDADSGSTGWATYADAAATSPVDGTGGSPSSTFAVSASSPLRGTSSFLWTKSAANRQGEGFSYAFTIDASDKAKVLQCSFEYQVASGTFADNDMSVWIYDVTNAVLIQPAPYLIKNSGIIEKFAVEFQTASNSTSYRLIVHTGSTSASAYTMKFDNFIVGPQAKLYGSAVTDWVSYAPNMSSTGILTNSGRWRRIGDTMEVECYIEWNGSGGGGGLLLDIPAGFSIDTAKLSLSTGSKLGEAERLDSGVAYYGVSVAFSDSNSVRFMQTSGSAFLAGSDFTAGDQLKVNFKVPIVGWSSSQVFSQDADVRVVNFVGYSSTNQALTASVTDLPLTSQKDSVGAWGGSSYTVKVPGDYQLSTVLFSASGTANVIVYVSGNSKGIIQQISPSVWISGAKTLFGLVAGDTITLRADSGVTVLGNVNSSVSISRISGPAQVAASESVSASYYLSANQSMTDSTTIANYDTKIFDTHGAVTVGASWKFTAPVSGKYLIQHSSKPNASSVSYYLTKNGGGVLNYVESTSSAANQISQGGATIQLLSGEYIQFLAGTTHTNNSGQANSFVTITRIGNY